jgi:hypothetical protein
VHIPTDAPDYYRERVEWIEAHPFNEEFLRCVICGDKGCRPHNSLCRRHYDDAENARLRDRSRHQWGGYNEWEEWAWNHPEFNDLDISEWEREQWNANHPLCPKCEANHFDPETDYICDECRNGITVG